MLSLITSSLWNEMNVDEEDRCNCVDEIGGLLTLDFAGLAFRKTHGGKFLSLDAIDTWVRSNWVILDEQSLIMYLYL